MMTTQNSTCLDYNEVSNDCSNRSRDSPQLLDEPSFSNPVQYTKVITTEGSQKLAKFDYKVDADAYIDTLKDLHDSISQARSSAANTIEDVGNFDTVNSQTNVQGLLGHLTAKF